MSKFAHSIGLEETIIDIGVHSMKTAGSWEESCPQCGGKQLVYGLNSPISINGLIKQRRKI